MLTVTDLSFGYKRGALVIDNISFCAQPGECLAVLGNNGAGKSTVLKCMNRILSPQSGSVMIGELPVSELPIRAVAKHMAFVDQQCPPTHSTVYDTVMLGRRPYIQLGVTKEDVSIVRSVLKQLKLEPLSNRHMDELSGGERQKVMIARALAQQPEVLLMDEPTSSLDLKNKYEVLSLVTAICREQNIISVIVLHDVNLALEYCDKFMLIKDHTVHAAGDTDDLTEEMITDVYGIPLTIHILDGKKVVTPK